MYKSTKRLLIELYTSHTTNLSRLSPVKFSCSIKEYPLLTKKPIKILFPFLPTYLCEAGFSSYTSIKATYRNRVNAGDVRIQLSSVKSDIKEICKNTKQCHSSIFYFEKYNNF